MMHSHYDAIAFRQDLPNVCVPRDQLIQFRKAVFEYKKAAEMLRGCRIDLKTLYNMDIQPKSKVKYTLFSLFGAYVHGYLLSKLHKKLC